ncbi:MAG TPA: carbon-nitrogen hydrolase family protein [Stellaceae bacterium]|nr:carbon-nitrogen hydrolase family protein [Stellaceae bacterium]
MTLFKAACIQLNAGREVEPNIRAASELVRRARDAGADLIMTPEVSDMIEPKRALREEKARAEAAHPMLAAFRDLARETGAHLLLGSIIVRTEGDGRLANRSFLIAPDGNILARYDKIHMFDVDLPGGESYRESAVFKPGEGTALAALPWGVLGLTVCYDLRFPHLYRALAQGGADFLTVPSAFTVPTGKAHWHVLLRARAIENGCFVFAPAQCGEHAEGRKTYGHSLIVAPWGEVLAEAGEEPGFILAEIDPAKIAEARRAVPSLGHDRPFVAPAKRPAAAE